MFGRDIVAWSLEPDEKDWKVREVHLLKDGTLWRGPWVFETMWNRWQAQMRRPYPGHLYQPWEALKHGIVSQERLAI